MTIVLSVVVLSLVVAGMAIGVMMGRKPIQGSCGGLNNVGLKGECEICGGNPNQCDGQNNDKPSNNKPSNNEQSNSAAEKDLAIDAAGKT